MKNDTINDRSIPDAASLSSHLDKPEIKTVIFDWGGVLIDSPGEGIFSYCSQALGISQDIFIKAYRSAEFDFYRNTITESQLWQQVCDMAGVKVPAECLDQANSIWFNAFEKAYQPKNEMFELVSRLKSSGYAIGLLSNTEMPSLTLLEQEDYNAFDFKVFSCVEGIAKPDTQIYDLAIKKADCRPQQCVFIDDREENIDAATAVGMNGIQFSDIHSLKQKLIGMDLIKG